MPTKKTPIKPAVISSLEPGPEQDAKPSQVVESTSDGPEDEEENPVLLPELDHLLMSEELRVLEQGERRVFYHPGRGSNGVAVGGGVFQKNDLPVGYTYDLDAWNGDGACPLKRCVPAPTKPGG